MRASKPSRVVLSLSLSMGLGLVLSLAACKDKLEDMPDVDPIDDPWVDNIEADEELTAEVAVDPVAPTTAAAMPEPTPTPSELAVAGEVQPSAEGTPDPATAEAAKLGGASVPTSKPK